MRFLKQRRKGAQTRARRKRLRIAKVRAWVQRFRGDVAEIAMDGFTQAEEHAMEPGAAAEGDTWAGASKAERMCTLPGARPFHLLNEKSTCTVLGVCVARPDNQTI